MRRCAPAWLLGVLVTAWGSQHAEAGETPSAAMLPETGTVQVVYGGRDAETEVLVSLGSLRLGFRTSPSELQALTGQTRTLGTIFTPLSGFRPPTQQEHGLRIVEVEPLLDPTRPFQRPKRALEFPAVATTARVQEWGAPLRDCVHRLRLPSRISDAGALSVQAQWHLRCNF